MLIAGPAYGPAPTVQCPRVATIPDSEVERVLVVVAHPDDVDFGAAGTVATWVDAGHRR